MKNLPSATHPRNAAPFAVPPPGSEVKPLQVNVAFTTPKGTLAALREAARLTAGLGGVIRVIVPRIVPYPLDLHHSPVSPNFVDPRFRHLCASSGIELRFEIVLCREIAHAFTIALEKHSLVIIGGRRRWWPSRENRLMRSLTCKGHNVLFVNTEKK